MEGVLCVDKPAGMTSHDVVARVRRLVGGPRRGKRRRKVGHAGTLDPDATGLLIVAVGRSTRLVPYLQASRKTYEAELVLGSRTDTLDASGEVLEEVDASEITEERLCEAAKALVGTIAQVPPMVSAVRVGGERLHERARRGEEVDREAREVTVHDLVVEDFEPGPAATASFLVTCSAGTYVRSLADDIGERLGVGGHLSRLRRLGSGRFSVDDAWPLEGLEALAERGELGRALLEPADAVADFPSVALDADAAQAVGHGKALPATGHRGAVAAVDREGRLLAMLEDDGAAAQPRVVLAPSGGDTGGGG